jgi:hypothetical protein
MAVGGREQRVTVGYRAPLPDVVTLRLAHLKSQGGS